MTVALNHTIVPSRDSRKAASFVAKILGRPPARPFGPFQALPMDNDVTLDFLDWEGDIVGQHYAFLVGEEEFSEIFKRIKDEGLRFWADPLHRREGQINTNDGGRGVYFEDPNGHNLEVITRPYGSGSG